MMNSFMPLVTRLVTFQKKTDAHLIALILNSEGLEVSGPGYAHPSIPPQTLNGKEAHIAIFGYPADLLVISHLHQIIEKYRCGPSLLYSNCNSGDGGWMDLPLNGCMSCN